MARRRKNRTHLKGGVASNPRAQEGVPKSFIIKHGQVGTSLTQLVRDMRKVMEPNTATRLRERARNKLKDFLTMAPPLGVTHLLAFTLTDLAPSFRIVRLSAGPTLSFRVERYSLIKDIIRNSKRAKSIGTVEYLTPPLLVLASFPQPGPGTPPHLSLVVKTFQTLFPPLNPQQLSLSSARRVVLVSYNSERGTIDFRHYLITVRPYGVSKRVQKILDGAATTAKSASSSSKHVLDLGNEKDIADFLLRKKGEPVPSSDGYESAASTASSVAGDDADAISLVDDYVGRNNRRGSKRAVRLDEIGPRMELRLIKISEGVPGKEGSVIYHEFVKKTKAEVAAQKAEHAAKEKLRQQRREEQERNVKRKQKEVEAKKGKGKATSADEDEDDKEEGEAGEGEMDEEEASGGANNFDGDDDWDEEEEISEGEDHIESDSEVEDSDSDEEQKPPPKKSKKSKR
ncbi:Brix-domain-containing protein [Panus rudis PR-1116 ss-1]|nr:Brix-domain-containing protein [Panus rudis PR-1116 ss-1]